MIKTKKVRQYLYKTEITAIICNKCGLEMDKQMWEMGSGFHYKTTGGYGSKLIDSMDGEYLTFDICDDCLIEFTNSFKIKMTLIERK